FLLAAVSAAFSKSAISRLMRRSRDFTTLTAPTMVRPGRCACRYHSCSLIVEWAPTSSSDCNDEQRLDVHNGLLLSALWDAAFDCGLVSFADNGSVLASSQLSETSRRALDLDNISPLTGLRDAHRANLALHRARNGF